MKFAPYSYSKIKAWLTCPAQFHARYVTKTVRFKENEAIVRGRRVHEHLEDSLKAGREPTKAWAPTGLLPKLHQAGARAEPQLAIDHQGNPCHYWADDCWLRGGIDVEAPYNNRNNSITLIDYKTGGFRPDSLQADIYAVLERKVHNEDLTVNFTFLYTDKKRGCTLQPDGGAEWRIQSIIERMEADTTFDPTPCWACRFCSVYTCPHNENY